MLEMGDSFDDDQVWMALGAPEGNHQAKLEFPGCVSGVSPDRIEPPLALGVYRLLHGLRR
jgi:hypothetical protein